MGKGFFPNPELILKSKNYLEGILQGFNQPATEVKFNSCSAKDACDGIFGLLSSRKFTYLSRVKSKPYEAAIRARVCDCFENKKKLCLYLVLGGGYHARTSKSVKSKICFDVGLGELLALYQVKKFLKLAKSAYPFGISFFIIIDNRCAEFANGIPVELTRGYAKRFSELINALGLGEKVEVVLQSDIIKKSEFASMIPSLRPGGNIELTEQSCNNAVRFSYAGKISPEISTAKYKTVNQASRAVISEYAKGGIHLMQRATASTLAFRSFPGGDSKIQCGEVALLFSNGIVKKPLLLTTQNIGLYNVEKVKLGKKIGPIKSYLVAVSQDI